MQADVLNHPTEENQAETKLTQKVPAAAVDERNEVEINTAQIPVTQSHVHFCAWMRRFAHQRDESPEPVLLISRFKRAVTPSEIVWR